MNALTELQNKPDAVGVSLLRLVRHHDPLPTNPAASKFTAYVVGLAALAARRDGTASDAPVLEAP